MLRARCFVTAASALLVGAAVADTIDTSGKTDGALATGGDQVYRVFTATGVDFVHVFTNTSKAATLTNISGQNLSVRYLAVGGGGAGGTPANDNQWLAGGGGGGGGGVAEAMATLSSEGSWSVRVGAGGVSGTDMRGQPADAGATSISNGSVEVVLAPGGGYGSQYCKTYEGVYYPYFAQPGAGGGGGGGLTEDTCRRGTNGTFRSYTLAGMSGGPYKGGDCTVVYTGATASVSIGNFATGGGGGAGGAGATPASNKNNPALQVVSGAGGAGLACDITGETCWYGAGGGGGGTTNVTRLVGCTNCVVLGGAAGATGVGGAGGLLDLQASSLVAQAGRDGTGTGGGGGLSAPKACGSCRGGNGGSGVVVVRYTSMTWRTEDMPTTLGQVGAQGAVTYSVSGEVEKDGDDIWLKPGTTATLYAVDAGGSLLVGWEDGETGELIRGTDLVQVTPATRRSYTAVFGKPWSYNTTTKKLTNGDWIFDVGTISSKIYVTNCTQAASDSVLNLATPMTNETGATFKPDYLGAGLTKTSAEAEKIEFISASICPTVRVFLPENVRVNNYCFRGAWGNATVRQSLSVPRNISFGTAGVIYGSSSLTNLFFEGGENGGQTILGSGTYAAFYGCTNLQRINAFPSTCTDSGNATFQECTSLTELYLPYMTNIGYRAFSGCSALTQIVFSAKSVSFSNHDSGNILTHVNTNCRYLFPSNAPSLPCMGTATVGSVSYPYTGRPGQALFGSSNGIKFYGSWRLDPAGWNKILTEVGSTNLTGKTLPTLDRSRGERSVKGVFYWPRAKGSVSTSEPYYGWLIDTKMPGEPVSGMMLFVR